MTDIIYGVINEIIDWPLDYQYIEVSQTSLAKYHESNLTFINKHSNIKGCQRFFIGLQFFHDLQVSLANYESPYPSARTTA